MGQVKQRHLYRWAGDHIAYRDASEYICDQRDRDAYGNAPAWHLIQRPIDPLDDEIEFDHLPTDDELRAAFKEHMSNADSERQAESGIGIQTAKG